MIIQLLVFRWSTSRARETYGYNVCTLFVNGIKKGSTCGGGYDMKGTALAEFLENAYQDRLLKLHRRSSSRWSIHPTRNKRLRTLKQSKKAREWKPGKWWKGELYGLHSYYQKGQTKPKNISLDGGCGFQSMEKIAKNIGLTLKYHDESNDSTTYTLTDKKL
tara:strand:+ start:490 stop:975 length:486 start_codon:yes stop_codon:yes gene_type:complete